MAGQGGFCVNKRLGLNDKGEISSKGPIKIGSLFSMMATLPKLTYQNQCTLEQALTNLNQSIGVII